MKYLKIIVLCTIVAVLAVGLFAVPRTAVRAQTAAADPKAPVFFNGGIPAGGTVGAKYPDGALAFGTYVNGVYTQIAFFSKDLVEQAQSGPVTVTDPKTGYQATLSFSGGKGTVTIKDANGNVVAVYSV